MNQLQMPKNYAPVLIRAQRWLQNALEFERLSKDESYSYTKRAIFAKTRNNAVYKARMMFAVAKRQHLHG